MKNTRKSEHEINQIFLDRWSPRALSPDITEEDLMPLFEAAKWAPSSSNIQPWRFIYIMKNSEQWNKLYETLVEFNKIWCKNAGALVLLVSKKTNDDNQPNKSHSFDSGAAWMSFALQASINNLVAHAIGGFDKEKATIAVNLPSDYQVEIIIAVGKHGSLDSIPERMRKSEVPNSRKELKEIIFKEKFN